MPLDAPGLPSEPRPEPWEWPLLAALFLAPLLGGNLDTGGIDGLAWPYGVPGFEGMGDVPARVWATGLEGLVWTALLLRLMLPGWRRVPLPATLAGRLLFAFVLVAGASLLVSVNRGASLRAAGQSAAWLAAFGLATDLARRPGGAARMLTALLAGLFVAATIGMRATVENARRGQWDWRSFGTFANPNLYASSLIVGLPLALAFMLRARRLLAATAGFIGLLLVSQLLSTGSRAAVLVLLAVLVLFAALAAWRGPLRGRDPVLRFAGFLAVAALVGALSSGALSRRGQTQATADPPALALLCPRQEVRGAESSNAFRVLTWRGTLRMAAARPVLGSGAGSFEYAYPYYAVGGFTRHAHQGYLQIAAEVGIPALGLWLAALAAAVISALRRGWSGEEGWWVPAVLAALAGSAAHNLVESTWVVPGLALLVWTLLGVAAGSAGVRPPGVEPPSEPDPEPRGAGRGDRSRSGVNWTGARSGDTAPLVRALILVAAFLFLGLDAATARAALLERDANDLVRRGFSERAREHLDLAVEVAPWNALLRASRANLLLHMGAPGALAEYERAVELSPAHSLLRYRLGRARERAGDPAGAVEAFRAAVRWSPQSTQAQLALAEALGRLSDGSGARAAYRRLLEIERSPAGQVRAIGGSLDYRFAIGHEQAGDEAARAGDLAGARSHYLHAACTLARVRDQLRRATELGAFVENPDLPDPERAARLRTSEQRMWSWLETDFGRRGEAAGAQAAAQLAAEASRAPAETPAPGG